MNKIQNFIKSWAGYQPVDSSTKKGIKPETEAKIDRTIKVVLKEGTEWKPKHSPVKDEILKSRFYVTSLDKRLDALGDVGMMVVGALKAVVAKVVMAVAGFFGFKAAQAQKTVMAIAYEKSALDYLKDQKNELPVLKVDEGGGGQLPLVQAAVTMAASRKALENMGIELKNVKIGLKLAAARTAAENGVPGAKEKLARQIKSYYLEWLLKEKGANGLSKKDLQKQFLSEVDKERGRLVPKEMMSVFNIDGRRFEERVTNLSPELGKKYLNQRVPGDEPYGQQINFIEKAGEGIRLSPVRHQKEAQGMIINGRVHEVSDGINSHRIYRSGAFAVYDMGRVPGIAKLKEIDKLQGEERMAAIKTLGRAWKMKNPQEIEDQLKVEIKRRSDMAVAQALPKLAAAIKDTLNNEEAMKVVEKTGKFLHAEQSFLSDGTANERAMAEDMKGAMDILRENLVVRIGDAEDLKVQGDKITLTLPAKGYEGKSFGVEALFFSQGVNEMQSISHLVKKTAASFQDKVNKESLERLYNYSKDADMALRDELVDLKLHYLPGSKVLELPIAERPGKDIEGVNLIDDAVRALNGTYGLVCKSGKDRTGTGAANALARRVAPDSKEAREKIRQSLFGGLSFAVTGQNTGKRNAYAFNDIQYETLPPQWRPPKRYCGNVPS